MENSKTRFTPGPWKLKFGGTFSDDGFGIVGNNASGPTGTVAECWPCTVDNEHRERLCADARLIAAAPELYAALQAISDWLVCRSIASAEDMAQNFPAMEQLASSALAKADGK